MSSLPLVWRHTGFEEVVERACAEWAGTPYRHGKCIRGKAVDCIHFGAAVLDRLYGSAHAKDLKSLPPDACVHNRVGVWKAVRSLLSTYPVVRAEDGFMEAGDLVITGPGTPSHLIVVGDYGRLWQAQMPCVAFTGYSIPKGIQVLAVYRAQNKELWTC